MLKFKHWNRFRRVLVALFLCIVVKYQDAKNFRLWCFPAHFRDDRLNESLPPRLLQNPSCKVFDTGCCDDTLAWSVSGIAVRPLRTEMLYVHSRVSYDYLLRNWIGWLIALLTAQMLIRFENNVRKFWYNAGGREVTRLLYSSSRLHWGEARSCWRWYVNTLTSCNYSYIFGAFDIRFRSTF